MRRWWWWWLKCRWTLHWALRVDVWVMSRLFINQLGIFHVLLLLYVQRWWEGWVGEDYKWNVHFQWRCTGMSQMLSAMRHTGIPFTCGSAKNCILGHYLRLGSSPTVKGSSQFLRRTRFTEGLFHTPEITSCLQGLQNGVCVKKLCLHGNFSKNRKHSSASHIRRHRSFPGNWAMMMLSPRNFSRSSQTWAYTSSWKELHI